MKLNKEYKTVLNYLRNGSVALLPTDTIYGLGCLAVHQHAAAKIFELKARPSTHNLPIMVHSTEAIAALNLDINSFAQRLLDSAYIPGDLTMILGFRSEKREPWLEGREEVAVRIPNDENLLGLLEESGPVLMTSANRHGEETAENVRDVLRQLKGIPDVFVDGGLRTKSASTIVNCRENPPVIIRAGRIGEEELDKILHQGG